MRIIGGKFKNRNFFMPEGIRPTQNVVRKAIFDLLGHDWEGINFLELFAGSGSVGLEALSRGAASVSFVEKDRKCALTIEENLKLMGLDPMGDHDHDQQVEVFNSDIVVALRQFARFNRKFDIIFADPPYEVDLAKKTLITLGGCDIFNPNCFLVFQHEKREILPQTEGPFSLSKQKVYGATYISIYQAH